MQLLLLLYCKAAHILSRLSIKSLVESFVRSISKASFTGSYAAFANTAPGLRRSILGCGEVGSKAATDAKYAGAYNPVHTTLYNPCRLQLYNPCRLSAVQPLEPTLARTYYTLELYNGESIPSGTTARMRRRAPYAGKTSQAHFPRASVRAACVAWPL